MTPRSLFNIILKIFGLFFLREIIYIIPQLISLFSVLTQSDSFDNGQYNNYGLAAFIFPVIIFTFYIFIIYLLIFNTNKVIDKLRLEKGFNQEEFSFNFSTSLILTIALIVIGGIILIEEIPNFCKSVFAYFQEKSLTHGMTKPNYSYIITSAIKIILGLLIIGERKRIVEFAEKRQSKKQERETENNFDDAT